MSGTACVPDPRSGPWQCEYGPDTGCGAILASCNAGIWALGGYAVNCTGGVGGGESADAGPVPAEAGEGPGPEPMVECPEALPTADAACYKPSSVSSYRCDYTGACIAHQATCTGTWQLSQTPIVPCAGGASGQ